MARAARGTGTGTDTAQTMSAATEPYWVATMDEERTHVRLQRDAQCQYLRKSVHPKAYDGIIAMASVRHLPSDRIGTTLHVNQTWVVPCVIDCGERGNKLGCFAYAYVESAPGHGNWELHVGFEEFKLDDRVVMRRLRGETSFRKVFDELAFARTLLEFVDFVFDPRFGPDQWGLQPYFTAVTAEMQGKNRNVRYVELRVRGKTLEMALMKDEFNIESFATTNGILLVSARLAYGQSAYPSQRVIPCRLVGKDKEERNGCLLYMRTTSNSTFRLFVGLYDERTVTFTLKMVHNTWTSFSAMDVGVDLAPV